MSTISYPKSITLIESGAFEGSSITKYPTWLSKGNNGDYGIFTKIKYKGTDKYSEAYKVLKIVNKERKSKGLSELKMDKDLLDVAMQRAAEVTDRHALAQQTKWKRKILQVVSQVQMQ